jgi:hypothetical protein
MWSQMGGVMLINLKEVKKCRNGAHGNFLLRGAGYALITISLKLNDTVAEYAATVLHELLHLWVTVMRLKGFRVTDTTEHKFIYAVEKVVIEMAKKHLKHRRKV